MGQPPHARQRAAGGAACPGRGGRRKSGSGCCWGGRGFPGGTQGCHLLRPGAEEGDGLDSCARDGGKLSARSRYRAKYKPLLGRRLAGTPGAAGTTRHPAPASRGGCWLPSGSRRPKAGGSPRPRARSARSGGRPATALQRQRGGGGSPPAWPRRERWYRTPGRDLGGRGSQPSAKAGFGGAGELGGGGGQVWQRL